MDDIESLVEVAKAGFFIVTIGIGVLVDIRSRGYVDLQKTMAAMGAVIERIKQLHEAGHIENLAEAVEEAIDLVKKMRKKNKLAAKIEHKIREMVRLQLGHLFEKPKREKK